MYKVNNVQLRKPTTARWLNKKEQGHNGLGKPIYGGYRDFELEWDFLTHTEFQTLHNAYLYSENTGSVVVDIPEYAGGSFVSHEYSGCYLTEPDMKEYFEGYYQSVKLIVRKVQA
jgi:hypothetical protein